MAAKGRAFAISRRANLPGALAVALGALQGGTALANPAGGQVVGGQATIANTAPNTVTINQATPRAAIDWQSFNIAPSETTRFVQPSASAVALNRVRAGDPSVIAGTLSANGQIILINPSGVLFTRGAQVNVNSLLATPTDISTADFMAGRSDFNIPSSDPNARIVNNGHITVAQKGLAALVGPGVANNGVIAARLGRVVLGGAETYTLDFYGDGLMKFDIGSQVPTAPLAANGQPVSSLVSNRGKIEAQGGTVLLSASAAAGILTNVIDMPGTIDARTANVTVGDVTIDAGPANNTELSGRIDVSGLRPGQTGGSAVVTGGSADLASTARIDARGSAGGGRVRVGTTPARATQTATVAAGAAIDASATRSGNGGAVAVLSDGATTFAGTILANGGPDGGNGGSVETSGGQLVLGPAATVIAGAPRGTGGTWLLDPTNLTIDATAATAIDAALDANTDVTELTNADGTTGGFGTAASGAGDIAVASALSWSTAATLTLSAYNNISVNSAITLSGAGTLTLISNSGSGNPNPRAGITVSAPITVSGAGHLAFTTTGNSAGPVFTTGQGSAQFPLADEASDPTLTINSAAYTLIYNMDGLADGIQSLNGSSGNFALAAPLDASGLGTVTSALISTFNGNFNGLGNTISNLTLSLTGDNLPGIALFGTMTGAIENLGIVGASLTLLGNNNAGAMLALANNGTISNSHVTASINTTGNGETAAALVYENDGTITNSYVTASINTTGDVDPTGALTNINNGTIADSHATASINIIGNGDTTGALANASSGPISNSYAIGSITINGGNADFGGLVGVTGGSGSISSSYANVAIGPTGAGILGGALGGLVGLAIGPITNSYAVGAVIGGSGSDVGGVAGELNGLGVTNVFAAGQLGGDGSTIGGIAASAILGTPVNGAYFDTTTTGTSTGINVNGSHFGTIGVSTATLAGSLPSAFSPTIWGNANNLVSPYILSNIGLVIAGTDTSSTPTLYNLVFTPTQLQNIDNNLSGNFALAQDIDMTGVTGFTPIGSQAAPYAGTFDGLGNVVANLTIDTSAHEAGLFGASSGQIADLGVIGGSVTSTDILAVIGSLVGVERAGSISNSYSTATVQGPSGPGAALIGGLVGAAYGTIADSYATGPVISGNGATFAGGFVGETQPGSTINDAYATGAVTGNRVGGFVADHSGTITNAYSSGAVTGVGPSQTVGGFVGNNSGAITGGYWNADRAGTGSTGVGAGSTAGVTEIGTDVDTSPFVAHAYTTFNFTNSPGATGNNWVMVALDGTLAANGDTTIAGTMPMLAFEAQSTIQNAHQLQLMAMNLAGNYTLGRNIDATATASITGNSTGTDVWGCALASCSGGFVPLGTYTGTFNGAGDTITGLTVNSAGVRAGLFGIVGAAGTIENVGLIGGSITDAALDVSAGDLAGLNGGTIINSSASGSVGGVGGGFGGGLVGSNSGSITDSSATGAVNGHDGPLGGLVGENQGTISQSFAAGPVTSTGGGRVGGLVGENDASGVITDAYAVGTATASSSGSVGGLVGTNGGIITNAYATGFVTSAGASIGGLVAKNSGSITNSYWDTGVTGQAGSAGGMPMTTAQLQMELPTGFNPAPIWGIVPTKSYPYLCWQVAACLATPQVVAGTVFTDQGTTPASPGPNVFGLVNGASFVSLQTLGTVGLGADGYYYYLLAPNTIPAGGNVVTYEFGSNGPGGNGAALADQVNGAATNLNIFANTLHEETPSTLNSALQAHLATAEGGNSTALGLVAGLANLQIDATGAFAVDTAINVAAGSLRINDGTAGGSAVALTQSAPIDIPAGGASFANGSTGGTIALTNASNIFDGAVDISTTGGGADAALTDSTSLELGLASVGGDLTLNGAGIFFENNVNIGSNTLTLISSASILGSDIGTVITAGRLTGSSALNATFVVLGGSERISAFGPFTTASGGIVLADGVNLTLSGAITAAGQTINLQTTPGVTITQAAGSVMTADTFEGSFGGAATLTGANQIANLGPIINSGAGVLSLTDAQALNVSGAVDLPGGVTLDVQGPLTQSNIGLITTGTLAGSSVGGVTLTAVNSFGNFGPWSDTGANSPGIDVLSSIALTTSGTISSTGPVTLSSSNLGDPDLTLATDISGTTVTLFANGAIDQTAGAITATTGFVATTQLDGGGAITLTSATNNIAGNVTLTSLNGAGTALAAGNLSLVDSAGFTVALNAPARPGIASSTGSVTLRSGGAIAETGIITTGGNLVASTLGGGAIALNDPANAVTGQVTLTSLDGAGTAIAGGDIGFANSSGIAITSTGGLATGINTTGTVTLQAGGSIGEASDAGLAATNLIARTLSDAGGAISLVSGTNTVSGNVTLTTMNSSGTALAAGMIGFGNTVGYTIASQPSGGAGGLETGIGTASEAGLGVGGTLTEATGAVISATRLTGTSSGGVMLNGANLVGLLGPFDNATSGNFSFVNAQALTAGNVSTSAGNMALTTASGDMAITAPLNALGNTVTLTSAGTVTESLTGSVFAATLTGSSIGGASLDLTGVSNNTVDTFGPFVNSGGGLLTFTNAQALATAGTVSSAGDLTLTTTSGDLTLGGPVIASGGTVTLNSAGAITEPGGAIDPGSLLIDAAGPVSLPGANTVDTLAASITGSGSTLAFNDTANNLTIGTVGAVSGVTTNNGAVTLTTTTSGGITLAEPVNAGTAAATIAASGDLAIGAGGAVTAGAGATLATLGNFSNAAGAGAIAVGAGSRWLVYSTSPALDTDDGLTAAFIQYAATYDIGALTGTAPAAAGNGLLYSLAPQITVTGVTKVYDGATGVPASLAAYTSTGAAAGDTVVLDTSGVAGSYGSPDAATGIDVTLTTGPAIASATHGGVPVFGYSVGAVTSDPIGTITPAALTASIIGNPTKIYDGGVTAPLTSANYSLGGFVGDQGASVTQTAGTYGSADVGTAIPVTATLTAANFTAVGTTLLSNYILPTGASGAGVITPATLTYAANAASQTYGGATPALSGSVTGFVAGQTQASATTGTLSFATPAMAASNVGSYAIDGSGLTADNGDYLFVQAAGNATALTVVPAALTVTPHAVSTSFSGVALNNPAYSDDLGNYTIAGLQNGQSLASAGIALSGSMAFNGSTGTVVENPGTYTQGAGTLSLGSTNENYALTFSNPVPNDYVITPTSSSLPPPPPPPPAVVSSSPPPPSVAPSSPPMIPIVVPQPVAENDTVVRPVPAAFCIPIDRRGDNRSDPRRKYRCILPEFDAQGAAATR
jgi:filamentous hemagglutinin family protein